jgi:hypothetical protein
MFIQELGYFYSQFPAGNDSSAWKGFVDGATVSEWNFTTELGAVNHQGVKRFDHFLSF